MAATPQPSPNGEKTVYQLAAEKLPASQREYLYRLFTLAKIPENDPVWAIVGVQAGILEPFVTNQPHVEALNKALSTVERAANRIERRSFYLNLGWPAAAIALTAALCLGGMAWWHSSAEKDEQAKRDQTVEAQLLQNLRNIGAKIDFDVADGGHEMTVKVSHGGWQLKSPVGDLEGNAEVVLVYPSPAPSPVASTRHR